MCISQVLARSCRNLFGTAMVVVALATSALAQDGSDTSAADAPVAVLNGETITRADLALASAEFGDQLAQVAPEKRDAALVDLVVNIRLAAKAARETGLDDEPAVVRRLDLARDRTLYSEYLRKKFIDAVTDDAVSARYDQEMENFEPEVEVWARHILVKTEEEAKAIIDQIAAGAEFAELAIASSTDPVSGPQGGDLGYFTANQMVEPFAKVAFRLKPGKYSKKPVQTVHGWHVIMVEDRRKQPVPDLESQSERIKQDLIRETFEAEIEALRAKAELELVQDQAANQ